jgi:hypothetical protein
MSECSSEGNALLGRRCLDGNRTVAAPCPGIPSELAQAPRLFCSCLAQRVSQRDRSAKMNTKIFKTTVPSIL